MSEKGWHDQDKAKDEADLIHRVAELKYNAQPSGRDLARASHYRDMALLHNKFTLEREVYNGFYRKQYDQFKNKVTTEIGDNQTIIDIGANNGTAIRYIDENTEGCKVIAVDLNEAALDEVRARKFNSTAVETIHADANEFLFSPPLKADAVILHAALHEINDPDNQDEYLEQLFDGMRYQLKSTGKLIIGDYYYGPEVTDKQVQEFMAFQLASIGHADEREKFINPNLLIKKASEKGFIVSGEIVDMRAASKCDRRYYLITFEKADFQVLEPFLTFTESGLPRELLNSWPLGFGSSSTIYSAATGTELGREQLEHIKPSFAQFVIENAGENYLNGIRAIPGFERATEEKYNLLVAEYNLALAEGLSEEELRLELIRISRKVFDLLTGGFGA